MALELLDLSSARGEAPAMPCAIGLGTVVADADRAEIVEVRR